MLVHLAGLTLQVGSPVASRNESSCAIVIGEVDERNDCCGDRCPTAVEHRRGICMKQLFAEGRLRASIRHLITVVRPSENCGHDVRKIGAVERGVDNAVFEISKAAAEGNFEGGNVVYDLSTDGVGYSTSGGYVDDIVDQLEEFKAQIVDGTITVPTEPS